MDIISDYRVSSHWANDNDNLELVAERVRRAYEQLHERESHADRSRPHRLGFLHRARHA